MDNSQNTNSPTSAPTKPARSGCYRFLVDVLQTLLLSVVLFLVINAVSARIRVDGTSMEPTLHDGEFIIVNKLAYKIGDPQQGDIVVFHFPRDPSQDYIKRIIGISGDKVIIEEGKVYVNGRELVEPYIAAPPAYANSQWDIPEGHLFVLGDNRNNSSDSHTWGTLPMEYVIGKALFVYWPLEEWGLIKGSSMASVAP